MSPTLQLLLQLAIILAAARLTGALLRYFGQPAVIGEMTAGLLLGPLVFGAGFPQLHAEVFPPASLPALSGLATLGVTLFMFTIGLELRSPQGNRRQLRAATLVGGLGIVLPLLLGLAISAPLYRAYAPPDVGFWPFALFLAAAMSVTAFPVLARILKDRQQSHSIPGRLALGAAVIDDACVWILLAGVLALAGGSTGQGVLLALGGGLALAGVTWALRPLHRHLLLRTSPDVLGNSTFAWLLVGLFGAAAFAEWVGLHAVFGAFLFGVSLPRDDRLLHLLAQRIEPLAVMLMMPILFAQAGQVARADIFAAGNLGLFGLILLVAISGKLIGCTLGARLSGHGWRDSLAVGSLMNARGLMELVVIKIGFDAGLIGAELFTLLFAMTLLTTLMATPLLSLFQRRSSGTQGELQQTR